MTKNLNIDLRSLRARSQKLLPILVKHASFIITLAVLMVYLFVVVRISQLAGAEPAPETDNATASVIPKVDENAIDQIQALEKSSTQVHSFFDSARKNPFSE